LEVGPRQGGGSGIIDRVLIHGILKNACFLEDHGSLRPLASAHKIGHGDGGEERNYGDDDHDFDEGKARPRRPLVNVINHSVGYMELIAVYVANASMAFEWAA
jgi:hypothetical protein